MKKLYYKIVDPYKSFLKWWWDVVVFQMELIGHMQTIVRVKYAQ